MRPDRIPFGHCQCGCGEVTNFVPASDRNRGRVKGQPYRYLQGHGTRGLSTRLPDETRYLVDAVTSCWNWRGHLTKDGYGAIFVDGRSTLSHRYFYERHQGGVPEGLELDHLCRNRRCVNPDHLEPVTRAVNVQRGDNVRLNASQVALIRAMFAGWTSDRQISFVRPMAAALHVSHSTIRKVIIGWTWQEVRDAA